MLTIYLHGSLMSIELVNNSTPKSEKAEMGLIKIRDNAAKKVPFEIIFFLNEIQNPPLKEEDFTTLHQALKEYVKNCRIGERLNPGDCYILSKLFFYKRIIKYFSQDKSSLLSKTKKSTSLDLIHSEWNQAQTTLNDLTNSKSKSLKTNSNLTNWLLLSFLSDVREINDSSFYKDYLLELKSGKLTTAPTLNLHKKIKIMNKSIQNLQSILAVERGAEILKSEFKNIFLSSIKDFNQSIVILNSAKQLTDNIESETESSIEIQKIRISIEDLKETHIDNLEQYIDLKNPDQNIDVLKSTPSPLQTPTGTLLPLPSSENWLDAPNKKAPINIPEPLKDFNWLEDNS